MPGKLQALRGDDMNKTHQTAVATASTNHINEMWREYEAAKALFLNLCARRRRNFSALIARYNESSADMLVNENLDTQDIVLSKKIKEARQAMENARHNLELENMLVPSSRQTHSA